METISIFIALIQRKRQNTVVQNDLQDATHTDDYWINC